MPLSTDPENRAKQLANLKQGGTVAPAGNARAKTHGGFATIAADRLEEREKIVVEALAADLPLRDPDGSVPAADALAVTLLAQSLCRLEDVAGFHGRRGIETSKGNLRNSVEVEGKLRREALDFCEALGLTPRGRVRLGLDLQRTEINQEQLESDREARERLEKRLAALDQESA